MSSCTIHAFDGKAPLICFSRQCFKETMSTKKKKIKDLFKSAKVKRKRRSNKKTDKTNLNYEDISFQSYDTVIHIKTFTKNDILLDEGNEFFNYLKLNKSKIKLVAIQFYHESEKLFGKRHSKRRRKSVHKFIKLNILSKKIAVNASILESDSITHKVDVFINFK